MGGICGLCNVMEYFEGVNHFIMQARAIAVGQGESIDHFVLVVFRLKGI